MSNINVNNLTPLLGSGSSVSVSGSLVVKNDVTIGGHLYIGDANTDSVTFSAEVSSSILPDANITYDLGSASKQWREVFLNSLVVKHITASGNISASGTGVNGTGSFHHLFSNGNIHATGTGSFDQAVIASNSSSFTYVSMSGALDTSHHVSASRILIHGGNNATGSVGTAPSLEVRATASIGYISASGDMTMSGTASFGGGIDALGASGSFQYVNVTDNISGSASGSFMDVFIDDNLEVQGVTNLHGNISSSNGVTASFGYLSSSGDIMANTPGVTASLTHVSASEVRGTSGSFTVLAVGRDIPNGTGTEYTTPTRPIDVRADEHNQLIRLDSTVNGGDCTINYRNSFGTDVNWAAGLDGGDNSFRITKSTEFSSVASNDYFIISANADVSSSGRVSASGGFETDAGTTSNFGNISSSGNLVISGHVSASRVSASAGFEADGGTTSNFGAISMSGNLTVPQVSASRVSASAGFEADTLSSSSFGYVSTSGTVNALGDVSSSGNVYGTQVFVGSGGALAALSGDGGTNIVKLGGASSGTQIHGVSIDITGSVSMSVGADVSMSGDGGISLDSGTFTTATGEIHAGGLISSSESMTANSYVGQHNGTQVFSVDNTGIVAASGKISSSGELAGTNVTIATNGINALTISTAGALSASSTLAGTAATFATNGDTYASISADGTGSFIGGVDAIMGGAGATGSFGYISCSQDVSSSGTVFGENIIGGAGNSIFKGNVKFEGGIARPIKSITADTTLDATAGVFADAGKTIVLNKADGCTVTLPAAQGTGNEYKFYVGTAITSNNYIIQVADNTDTMSGAVHMVDADDDSQTTITAKGTDDTITLNGGTQGGAALGDVLIFTDIATNKYIVQGNLIVPAGSNPADPFSAAV